MASRISRAARPPSPPSSAVAAVAVHHSTRNFSGAALAHMKPAAPAVASTVAVSSFAFRSLPAATMAGVYSAPHPTHALPPSSVVHRVERGAAKRWQPSTRTAALLSALRSPLWSAMRTMPVMEPTGLISPARVTFADGAGGRRAQSTYGTNVEQLTRPGGATTFENPIPVPQPLTPGSGPGSGRAPGQGQRPKDVVFTERKLTVGGEREDPQQNKPLEKPLLKGLDPKLSTFQDTTLADVIRDKGSETVLWIDEGAFIFDAVKKMDLCRVGGLLVKGRDGAVAGIVTERDYLTKVALRGLNSRDTKVEQIMSRDLKFGTMKQSSREALSLMTQYRFRHLPVVGDSGELVGLISIGDLVKSILAEVAETAEFYRDFVEGKYRYSASYQEGYRDDIKS